MSELSQQKIDVSKIEIVADKASFTGYSIKPLDHNAEEGMPGLPASVFEVALYKEIRRLKEENEKLRTFIDKLRRIGNETDYVFALDAVMKELETMVMGENVAA